MNPVRFRYDTARDVEPGQWLVEPEHAGRPERLYVVVSCRLVRHRVQLPVGVRRWSLVCQERQGPTEAEPWLPVDYPRSREDVHMVYRYSRCHPLGTGSG